MKKELIENIRSDYDRIADEYARRIFNELEGKPLDRELLKRFAAEVKERGAVCDMGCGPGHVASYLHAEGVEVFGLDLSPRMVEQARRLNADISFREGNMLALDIDDGTLAGITAFYAVVNIPTESLPAAFGELHRVLKPGGLLLLAFHIGDEVIRPSELWGRSISMEFFHLQPARILNLLIEAGFEIEEVIEREPYAPEVEYQSRRAYVFVRKPIVPANRTRTQLDRSVKANPIQSSLKCPSRLLFSFRGKVRRRSVWVVNLPSDFLLPLTLLQKPMKPVVFRCRSSALKDLKRT